MIIKDWILLTFPFEFVDIRCEDASRFNLVFNTVSCVAVALGHSIGAGTAYFGDDRAVQVDLRSSRIGMF